ncbi:MAG: hypothetical protein ABIR25_05870 [Sphingomicrobium sp.]
MMRNKFTLPALLALALAACQQPTDTNIAIDNEVNAAEAANAEIETLPPSEEGGAPAPTGNAAMPPLNEAEDDSENSPSTAVIPAQYRGRWGMNINDCDPKRSDNKGLMTVRENSIRFYESTAALQEQRPAIATSFSGTYSFTGEGQSWERVVTLTRTGNTLKRADNEGSYTYTRCA